MELMIDVCELLPYLPLDILLLIFGSQASILSCIELEYEFEGHF